MATALILLLLALMLLAGLSALITWARHDRLATPRQPAWFD
ncbi:hypothetical protein [Nocardioides humi]|nr:hypothetical protein [Nocardioides humi]